MAERQNRIKPATSPEDKTALQTLSNQIRDSTSTLPYFATFVEHLGLAVALLQQWERLEARVDYLERREHDVTTEIERLEAKRQQLEAAAYAR